MNPPLAEGPPPPGTPPLPLLAQRNFAALWWGQLISILGERLTYLALVGLLAEHTHQFRDPRASLLLTLLANVMLAPVLLFSPFIGAWIDRWNLKRVLVTSDILRGLIVLMIPVLYSVTHHTGPVFVMVFALFTCNVLFLPAKSSITPEIVPPGQLLAANAWLSGAGIASTAVGALAGGWVVDHWGWPTALTINAFTYLVSVVALAIVAYRPARPEAPPHDAVPQHAIRRYLSEVGQGWAVVRRNAVVGVALVALGAVWVGGGFLHVAGNQHIQRAASAPGMERVGVLLFALGLGSGISTWWTNRYARGLPRSVVLGVGLMLAGGGVVAFAVSTRFAVFAVSAFAIGLAAAPSFMLTETMLQEGTELRQRGRVFSARDFLMRLVFLVAVTVAGWTSRALGLETTLLISAAAIFAAGLLAIVWGRSNPLIDALPGAVKSPSTEG